jgi:hypothetical protein
MAELNAMEPRFSQWLPGEEISEKHWMYRWAKNYWFNDFHASAEVTHGAEAEAKDLQRHITPSSPHPPERQASVGGGKALR